MGRGKRYDSEPRLNIKKVMAVLIVILAIVLFVVGIKKLLKSNNKVAEKNIELAYFPSYTDGKWGVINSSGNNVIEPTYGEMIVIPDKKKAVFICTYEVNYANGTYKTKAVNASNQDLFTAYSSVEALSSYDQNGKIWYENNVLKVEKDGKYGLINLEGTEILPVEYDKIFNLKGIKNSIVVQKGNSYGICNCTGSLVVEPKYAEISSLTEDYANGYIVKTTERKIWGNCN